MGPIWLQYGFDMASIWLLRKSYGNIQGVIKEYSINHQEIGCSLIVQETDFFKKRYYTHFASLNFE